MQGNVLNGRERNSMVNYLNHSDYNRWYRHYILNLTRYAAELDALRIALDDLPGREKVEDKFEEIDKKMEEIIPRNFDQNGMPLESSEIFVENSKILINLLFKAFGADLPFQGIYQTEKERILRKHHEYRFKDQFKDLKTRIEEMVEQQKIKKEMKEALSEQDLQSSQDMQDKVTQVATQPNVESVQTAPGSNINSTIYSNGGQGLSQNMGKEMNEKDAFHEESKKDPENPV